MDEEVNLNEEGGTTTPVIKEDHETTIQKASGISKMAKASIIANHA